MLELRTAADAEALKAALGPGKRLAVVGGGYIGLEAAASARALGAEVVVVERESPRAGPRRLRAAVDFFQDYHREHGVTFELAPASRASRATNGHVTGVRLADGRVIACDAALVGVGAMPNDEIAREAGLDLRRRRRRGPGGADRRPGDLRHRRRHPPADADLWPHVPPGERAQRAGAGQAGGRAIIGRPAPAPEVPWYWSDQYDLKLQIAGIAFDVDEIIVRGDPRQRQVRASST